ncbi:DUF4157 domain-containing protein [Actinopolymorpha rutila]|uniref:DUF4157 domain-containing protein n=1 Tax=Actinopolymorpha rutila TaxID=446787 RepID=A0A852ZG13_9ACTN|nr:DUF4157 domain-containing protein [Actinopolymorpha rutila]NYH90828.1 hypothetical protein [Actinopolymorpha rutila]
MPEFSAVGPRPTAARAPADAAVGAALTRPGRASLPSRRAHWDLAEVAVHEPGRPLPSTLRSVWEARLGEPLDQVRLHTGPEAEAAAREQRARAFTVGEDITLGGTFDEHLLGHELTHVVQFRRAGRADTLAGPTSAASPAAEREATRVAGLARHGLPTGPVREAAHGVARTPVSDDVEFDLSYALNDWAVTAEEERRILDRLAGDSDLSATIVDLRRAGMLDALFDRIDAGGNRRRLYQILGAGRLNAAASALVEPYLRRLGTGAELQYFLGRHGVTTAAPAFNPAPLEAAVVGTRRTARTGVNAGGFLTEPFTGSGATGIISTESYQGTFYRTPGLPSIPVEDEVLMAAGHRSTLATYQNPLTGPASTGTPAWSPTHRRQQAELLLRRPIASIEADSYAGNLPSRAQVFQAAARAHNLTGALVAAFVLTEQRDQSQAEDAADYQSATSRLAQHNSSIGLGQVVVSTARRRDLFADLMTTDTRQRLGVNRTSGPGQFATADLLASEEYNIFAVARYIRQIADQAAGLSLASLPNTAAQYPGINLGAYAGNPSTWPDDNVRALGSEYTSTPWDDSLVPDWGDLVFQAYQDVRATGIL